MTRAFLAVRVAVSPAAWHPPSATLPRAGWAPDFDPVDGAVPEFGVEPADQHRCQQPYLGGPRGLIRGDDELAVRETVRAGVGSEV